VPSSLPAIKDRTHAHDEGEEGDNDHVVLEVFRAEPSHNGDGCEHCEDHADHGAFLPLTVLCYMDSKGGTRPPVEGLSLPVVGCEPDTTGHAGESPDTDRQCHAEGNRQTLMEVAFRVGIECHAVQEHGCEDRANDIPLPVNDGFAQLAAHGDRDQFGGDHARIDCHGCREANPERLPEDARDAHCKVFQRDCHECQIHQCNAGHNEPVCHALLESGELEVRCFCFAGCCCHVCCSVVGMGELWGMGW